MDIFYEYCDERKVEKIKTDIFKTPMSTTHFIY